MRLTQKDTDGKWILKGLPWEKIKVGQEITKHTWEKLYGALCKLKDYEDTGLTIEQVEELENKQEPLPARPVLLTNGAKGFECQNCGNEAEFDSNYCQWCGQKLEW